jgi:predicted metal-dependent hydrolase
LESARWLLYGKLYISSTPSYWKSGRYMTNELGAIGLSSGLALFNCAEFFEAHEALEDVWREAQLGSPRRRHLQGLVQLAVAFHHESRQNFVGARSVLERALRNLKGAEESFPSLDLDHVRAVLSNWQGYLAVVAPRKGDGVPKRRKNVSSKRPKLPVLSSKPKR